MTFASLIWPAIDAKRFRLMLYVDAIVRLDLILEAME